MYTSVLGHIGMGTHQVRDTEVGGHIGLSVGGHISTGMHRYRDVSVQKQTGTGTHPYSDSYDIDTRTYQYRDT